MPRRPRDHFSLDDLFLHVYVLVDDWLPQHRHRLHLPEQPAQVASYSELFTIALVGELVSQPFESVWYWLVKERHHDLFPCLPEYSRYHRILRNAERVLAEFALALTRAVPPSRLKLIDALPVPVAKGKRAGWARMPEASKGFSTMGMVYGFKLHAVVSEKGLFERWSLAPANHSEVTVARGLLEGLPRAGEVVVGDKGYVGLAEVVKPKRKNMKRQEEEWTPTLHRARKRIETSFSVLVGSLCLRVGQVKTFLSLRLRVNLKIAAHNLVHSEALFS